MFNLKLNLEFILVQYVYLEKKSFLNRSFICNVFEEELK